MKIAIDIDNVITNTTECVLQYINERLPINLKMEDIKEYWMEKAIPEQFQWIAPMAFDDKAMWKRVRLIDGAAEVIEKLYKDGHEIYFATATTAENFRKKVGFLTRSFPFLPKDYVRMHAISIKKKQLLDVDVLIDDYSRNLEGPKRYNSICYDYPWNQDFVDDRLRNFRIHNWNEIYDVINNISGGKYTYKGEI